MTKMTTIRAIVVLYVLLLSVTNATATVYFAWTSEDQSCDSAFPFYWENVQGFVRCGITGERGDKCLGWSVTANTLGGFTEISNTQNLPSSATSGSTYHLAFFVKFSRIGGADLWHEGNLQSYDKLADMIGSGVRWTVLVGQHEASCAGANTDSTFTSWVGNPTHHLNSEIECIDYIHGNVSPYISTTSPIQLNYDKWHSLVMSVKFAYDHTGSITFYVNGNKVVEHVNIQTTANSSPTLTAVYLNGTFAQSAYDVPLHNRYFDNLLLTDSWQDILDGGYLSEGTTPPSATNLRMTSTGLR